MTDLSLVQDFITESLEHLEELESSLLKLEQDTSSRETLDDIFRAIHTIKGASQFTGLVRTSELSHKLENLLDLLREGGKEVNQEIIDTLIDTKDRLALLTSELEQSQEEKSEVNDLVERINQLTDMQQDSKDKASSSEPDAAGEEDGDEPEETPEAILDTSILGDDTSLEDETVEEFEVEEEPNETLSTDEQSNPVDSSSGEEINDGLIIAEISGETYDEELFNIFLQQVESNLTCINDLIEEVDSSKDRDELLGRIESCLESMKSSANYMGYENLNQLFKNWLAQTVAARKEISEDVEVSLEFMDDYGEQVARILLQITDRDSLPADEIFGKEADGDVLDSGLAESSDILPQNKDIDENLIREEVSGEAYDEELFSIFIQQASANLSAINKQLKENEPNSELLEFCDEKLANLKQSANYMDYNHLLSLYENWQSEIKTAHEQLAADQDINTDFIRSYIDQVVDLLPGVDTQLSEKEVSVESSEIFKEEDLPAPTSKTTSESEEFSPEHEEEGGLFDMLSGSVDASLDGETDEGTVPLHGIIEEMLSDDESHSDEAEKAGPETTPQQDTGSDLASMDIEQEVEPGKAVPGSPELDTVKEKEENSERRKNERRLGNRRKEETAGKPAVKQTVRVDSGKIDALMNQVGELVVSRAYFSQILTDLRTLQQDLKQMGLDQRGQKPVREISFKLAEATVSLGRISNELQEGVMKVRMLPVAQLFNRYPRLVRDLVRKTDKKIELVIKGEDTELDKMVIEEISDPLIHIIRNAVDHGIETSKERKKAGKPKTSTLTLEAYHESNHIVIEITDDGRGIDTERIKAKALEKGLIGEHDMSRMSDTEARRFIMMPGFSTAEKATETSGRGVGMDVIKTNIEKLNGTVEIDSELGVQTRIRIKIPLTLAIIQALLIRVGPELYTIPLSVVEETLRIYEHETSVIEGVEVIHLRDTTMPIFKLSELFGVTREKQDMSKSFVVVVTTGMQRIGLVVDELMGQEEVVIKPLVDYLREESGFSGATIIGDGRISLILDIYELVKMTSRRQADRYKEFAEKNKRFKDKYQESTGLGDSPKP